MLERSRSTAIWPAFGSALNGHLERYSSSLLTLDTLLTLLTAQSLSLAILTVTLDLALVLVTIAPHLVLELSFCLHTGN